MDFVKYLISICLLLNKVECDVQFQYDSEQCLDQPVEYQCTVTGSGLQVLTWKVYTDNGTQIGSSVTYVSNTIGASVSIDGVFTVEQLSPPSPLTSNISFTVQSSINGYTIICEDGSTMDNETLKLDSTFFEYSGNVAIHTDAFTSTSVSISWTESPPYCGPVIYRYNISSEPELVESVTNDNVIVGDLVPSDDPYCITVNVIYTYDTRTTNEQCFLFQVPNPVQNVISTNETESNTTNVTVGWEESMDFNVQNQNTVTPPFMNYRVTLFNSTDGGSVSYDSGLLSPGTITYTFTGVSQGRIYTVTVEAINGVGKSSTTTNIAIAGAITFDDVVIPSSSTSSMIDSTTSFTMPDSSPVARSSSYIVHVSPTPTIPSRSNTKKAVLETPVIVGIVAGGIIFILVITVVVVVIVYCVCSKKDHGSADFMTKASAPIPLKETHTSSRAQPETGQPTYEDPGVKVQHKQAPTGDLYAEPDVKSSGRRPPPQPTYQDPNTIQRQQAPTGDMYAMPEKKPTYSQVKKPGPVEVYADLDMSSVSPRSPQPLIPSESQQQVLYSDVKYP